MSRIQKKSIYTSDCLCSWSSSLKSNTFPGASSGLLHRRPIIDGCPFAVWYTVLMAPANEMSHRLTQCTQAEQFKQ